MSPSGHDLCQDVNCFLVGFRGGYVLHRRIAHKANGDITCTQAAKLFRSKESHYPYSDRYRAEVHSSPDAKNLTEREHMIGWFTDNQTTGSGSYTRETSNLSARRCYNRLMNAASLLWIAEAVGIDELTVKQAFESAKAASDYRKACGAIRAIITWDMIYEKM